MIVFPNAKINLGLNILGKRGDGFHNIDSVFLPIPLHDALEIVLTEGMGEATMSSSGLKIPGNPDQNLCLQAYKILNSTFGLPSVKMHLHKVIPMGAGLGGGSADGSFALSLLNDLCGLGLEQKKLESFALELGSDCPFFIENAPKHVTGRGEIMNDCQINLSQKWLLLVFPQLHISTAEAYAHAQVSPQASTTLDRVSMAMHHWKSTLENGFEKSAFRKYPELQDVKESLYRLGASYASMTGSGSTLFGFFDEPTSDLESIPYPYELIQL